MTADLSKAAPTLSEYYSETKCTWCDGCGNYAIRTAVKMALVELSLHPWQVCLCYDIGCHGNASDKIQGYRFHGIHGRVIPFAAGVKLANMQLPVIAFGGDGATFSEGVGHLVHGVRSNYPITFILHNNADYGLTTGQASALTWQEQPMNWSPNGIPERTLASMELLFSLQPTFVARGFTGNIKLMTRILQAAIQHRGFAFVDMLQACPTYDHFATHTYLLERCYDANAEGHDPSNIQAAKALATQTDDRIACGILYQREDVPSFYERLVSRHDVATTCVEEVKRYDVSRYWRSLR
ncbi:thiamine pyrophosphate-dependent enzyme [Bradyrhizobium pachyrhizi]|nr:thiamine pyrophosphate-dependent enzyme [Bradyrhizobium pachyrhizi]